MQRRVAPVLVVTGVATGAVEGGVIAAAAATAPRDVIAAALRLPPSAFSVVFAALEEHALALDRTVPRMCGRRGHTVYAGPLETDPAERCPICHAPFEEVDDVARGQDEEDSEPDGHVQLTPAQKRARARVADEMDRFVVFSPGDEHLRAEHDEAIRSLRTGKRRPAPARPAEVRPAEPATADAAPTLDGIVARVVAACAGSHATAGVVASKLVDVARPPWVLARATSLVDNSCANTTARGQRCRRGTRTRLCEIHGTPRWIGPGATLAFALARSSPVSMHTFLDPETTDPFEAVEDIEHWAPAPRIALLVLHSLTLPPGAPCLFGSMCPLRAMLDIDPVPPLVRGGGLVAQWKARAGRAKIACLGHSKSHAQDHAVFRALRAHTLDHHRDEVINDGSRAGIRINLEDGTTVQAPLAFVVKT